MSDEGKWRVIDCFSGPECWCGIIVNPDGEECNNYGEISRKDCLFIIDAMNGDHGKEYKQNNSHPLPWHVYKGDGNFRCIVTTAGMTGDELDHCVGTAKGEYNRIFVDAVNGFYEYEGKE